MNQKIMISTLVTFVLCVTSSVSACTGFTASNGDTVLMGNNEDYNDPDTYLWFTPPEQGKFGCVYFGYGNFYPQGGMNDKGLCFDGFGAPFNPFDNPESKPIYGADLVWKVMEECQTIDEVVDMFNTYYLPWMARCLLFFVDSSGNSAIFEGDNIIYKEGDFQVVTNFYQSNPHLGGWPCWRYDTAVGMLEDMVNLSVEYFRDICDAVHYEGVAYPTQYSNIYDIKNGLIYLYFFHSFDECIIFDLHEELEKGYHRYHISSLFQNNPPSKPNTPQGITSGKSGTEYVFTSSATDPDGDQLYYLFDWDDGFTSFWLGPFESGEECSASHIWFEQGSYQVRVKAQDSKDAESDWSDPLPVSMPLKHQTLLERIIEWILQLFRITTP